MTTNRHCLNGGDDNKIWVCEQLLHGNPNSLFSLHMSWEGACQRMRELGYRPVPFVTLEEDRSWIRPRSDWDWDDPYSWADDRGRPTFDLCVVYQEEVGW